MSRLWLIALAGCSFELTSSAVADDGGSDAVDNCPMNANPNQRDWDSDKHGDVCDRCPHLESAADPDGDGDGGRVRR